MRTCLNALSTCPTIETAPCSMMVDVPRVFQQSELLCQLRVTVTSSFLAGTVNVAAKETPLAETRLFSQKSVAAKHVARELVFLAWIVDLETSVAVVIVLAGFVNSVDGLAGWIAEKHVRARETPAAVADVLAELAVLVLHVHHHRLDHFVLVEFDHSSSLKRSRNFNFKNIYEHTSN